MFKAVAVSLLAVSVSSVLATPIPDLTSEQALAAREFADVDLTDLPFEKREENEILERGFGDDEALELYVRDLYANAEQDLSARGFDEGEDLERRSWVSILSFVTLAPRYPYIPSFSLDLY